MKTPEYFSFVKLGSFGTIPNHIHGIIIIDKNITMADKFVETPKLDISTTPTTPTESNNKIPPNSKKSIGGKNEKWQPGSIAVIINQFKRTVTINARKIKANFGWQSRFHDHIIRDKASFERIENYTINNPKNWKEDKFF